MLWEKKTSLNEKRGYLYIRETIYVRDKRTLKRKPSKLGDGSAYKQRGKYSKKKDIYCGKIIEGVELQKAISFREYMESVREDNFLEYKTSVEFEVLLDNFVEYLLAIHNIEKDEFTNRPKKAYVIATGYLSLKTIENVREFTPKNSFINYKELERFANKCFDAAIFDEEIIMLLYSKLLPDDHIDENFEKELQLKSQEHKGLGGFIRSQHD